MLGHLKNTTGQGEGLPRGGGKREGVGSAYSTRVERTLHGTATVTRLEFRRSLYLAASIGVCARRGRVGREGREGYTFPDLQPNLNLNQNLLKTFVVAVFYAIVFLKAFAWA